MSEIQEKVWVVTRYKGTGPEEPVKVFDDRADARAYAKRMNAMGDSGYNVYGVKKG